jgi:hydrogenase maturation protein HypF
MARDIAAVERICTVTEAERSTLVGPRRPIVILPRRREAAVSDAVAPGNTTLGVMLPYTPLHYLLFEGEPTFEALVMTSGNVSEEPIVSREEELPRIAPLADEFLTHNRKIHTRVDDSVVRVFEGRERVIRRSRGFAPHPISLGFDAGQALGAGAELKNTFCLTNERYAILSQHIGDLENYETLEFFSETLEKMKRFFRIEPEVVAYDLHPGYLSTRFAMKMDVARKIGVQHHHAHIASCMAENGITEKVIGVAFDGTGYGTDGQIWGGEVLTCDFSAFERRLHLRYVALPGGDTAIREPWRAALSYVRDAFGRHVPEGLFDRIPHHRRALVESMLDRNLNTFLTSSCGRLFDAVAFLVGLRDSTNYEGQAAIELEAIAEPAVEARFGYAISGDDIDMRPACEEIVRAVQKRERAGWISAAFHNTVAAAVIETCCRIRESDGTGRVCLSGGTFQNLYLLRRAVEGLRSRGFEVFLHARTPANDGGIALGQAVIAACQKAR